MPSDTSNNTALFDCAKCDGVGRIRGFSHVESGKCFSCGGSGRIRAQSADVMRGLLSGLRQLTDIVLEAADRNDIDRRDAYLGQMIPSMFKIGTAHAKAVLAEMRSGAYHDEDRGAGYRTERCRRDAAHAAADRLVAMGRS